jgi:hypothetical protein
MDKSTEICANCINWDGDSLGEQGDCFPGPDETPVRTGRYEDCIHFIAREIPNVYY